MIQVLPAQQISPYRLQRYSGNSKIHTPKQIDHICGLITEFGFTEPIHVNENYEILAGHGRHMAALQLKMALVPIIQITGLTESQQQTYRIAHNQSQLSTGFDSDILKSEVQSLCFKDYGVGLLGLSDRQLKDLKITVPELPDLDNLSLEPLPKAPVGGRVSSSRVSAPSASTAQPVVERTERIIPTAAAIVPEAREYIVMRLKSHDWDNETTAVLQQIVSLLG
jgi:hypothetical protein